ncbi:hypothetical protein OC835_004740 [Tilletia horrida]|nr:hypothetical protein OC835_004740 [Tilletia horrida]KAK0563127.1 hypothetical protein OC844_002354 [Tilletia horrida]
MEPGTSASAGTALTEKNLLALAAAPSNQSHAQLPIAHRSVLDYVAEQAALLVAQSASPRPDQHDAKHKPAANADRRKGKALAQAGTEVRGDRKSPSPFMEARIAPKSKAREHPTDTSRSRREGEADDSDCGDGAQDNPEKRLQRRRIERDREREQREAEERLRRRKERRREKALIVRDGSRTAAQKLKERNARRNVDRAQDSGRSDCASDVDIESDGDKEGRKKRKKKKADSKSHEAQPRKTARKHSSTMAAIVALDRPKSVQQGQRLTIAPTLGVFNKGVASSRTRPDASSRRQKVPTSDLIFSELKFFGKPSASVSSSGRQKEAPHGNEDAESSDSVPPRRSSRTQAEEQLTDAGADERSSRFFKKGTFRMPTAKDRRNTDHQNDGVEDGELSQGDRSSVAIEWSPSPPVERHARTPCHQRADIESLAEEEDIPQARSHPEHHHAQDSSSKRPSGLTAEPSHQQDAIWRDADVQENSYLNELAIAPPANAWRREHGRPRAGESERMCRPPLPRLYTRIDMAQDQCKVSFNNEALESGAQPIFDVGQCASRAPSVEYDGADSGMPYFEEEEQSHVDDMTDKYADDDAPPLHRRRMPLTDSCQLNQAAEGAMGPAPRLPSDFEHRQSDPALHHPTISPFFRALQASTGEPERQFHRAPWENAASNLHFGEAAEAAGDDFLKNDRMGKDPHLFVEALHSAVNTYPTAFPTFLAPSARPSWCIRDETVIEDSPVVAPRSPLASVLPLQRATLADGEVMGLQASQLQSFWEPFRT